jgi:MFS family permease
MMEATPKPGITRGQWMALTAALLGWLFDGLEMGLFPLVAYPALGDLLNVTDRGLIAKWFGVATAGFLVGAATGGVLFGWLGDRIGRVRAMMLSVLTYALFSGLGGVAQSAEQLAIFRFIAALGMGGEWSLGVALVMEIWPNRSRALLAGLIGAAANVGYLLIAFLGLILSQILTDVDHFLRGTGLPSHWVDELTGHEGWRILMLLGALPALLTFFIRLFVPESEKWQEEQAKGTTSHWATRDLLGVLLGATLGGGAIIYLWAADDLPLAVRIAGSVPALVIVTVGYLYPVIRYFRRSGDTSPGSSDAAANAMTIRRMLLGACLGGVALLGTWASIQQVPTWTADMMTNAGADASARAAARSNAQIASSTGAIIGTIAGALIGGWLGRRVAYFLLCLGSLATALALFQLHTSVSGTFFLFVFLSGGLTASFYGWLPLYLPELFPTRVRATGQISMAAISPQFAPS